MLSSGTKEGPVSAVTPASPSPSMRTVRDDVSSTPTTRSLETQSYTESALRELYQHVTNMPESAKKKKLIRQVQLVSIHTLRGKNI